MITKTEKTTLLGARSGQGTATFPNGDVYEGTFGTDGKGLRHGPGKYTYAAPPPAEEDAGEEAPPPVAVYDGGWTVGKKSGVGIMTYADGCKYQGSWSKGQRHGIGAFYYPNGDIYTGEWAAGKKNGHGTYIYKETKTRLKGTWEEGKCVSGEFSDQFGNVYEGKFSSDGAAVGFMPCGKFTLASGAVAPSAA